MHLQTLVYSSTPGIIAITETWLNDKYFDNEILPHDYFIYRKDRNSRGGGVLLAVHRCVPSRLIESPPNLEVIAVSLININLIVCVVYVPPNVSLPTFNVILFFLAKIISMGPVIILGDFNLPDIDWLTLSCSSPLSSVFCDFVFDNNLTQHILEPTHYLGNCLDLALSNCPQFISPVGVRKDNPIKSDHFLLSFNFAFPAPHHTKPATKSVPDLSKLNYDDLAVHLLNADFSDCMLSDDVNFIWAR